MRKIFFCARGKARNSGAGRRSAIVFLILFLLLIFSLILSLVFGATRISFLSIFGAGENRFEKTILLSIRLPRTLLVLVTGILLGGSGAVFQLFFRNPLAEPGIMGISSGATLGAVCASVLGLGASGAGFSALAAKTAFPALILSPVNFFAFAGALGAGVLVTTLAFTRAGRNNPAMLLICGTALGTLYSSISSMILLTANKEFHSIYAWILGSFNGRGWKELIFILIPAAASVAIMLAISAPLDLLASGEVSASSLGVEVTKLRVMVLVSGALAVSAGVCAGGTIGFVGLIAPHIVRKLSGPRSRTLIPLSMIFGAALLLLSDTLARVVIAPSELPAGIITSILGVPFFLSLCLTQRRSL